RLDDIIVFRQLTFEEVRSIAGIMLREVASRLTEQEISLEVTDKFKDRVVKEGFNPKFGARELRRAIMRLLEDSLAEAMLSGAVNSGDTAVIDIGEDGEVEIKRMQKQELVVLA
ncbi:MAG: ATP-dependent Clp protease ATP-binding subunit ClpC, partial [Crinalium sp.]